MFCITLYNLSNHSRCQFQTCILYCNGINLCVRDRSNVMTIWPGDVMMMVLLQLNRLFWYFVVLWYHQLGKVIRLRMWYDRPFWYWDKNAPVFQQLHAERLLHSNWWKRSHSFLLTEQVYFYLTALHQTRLIFEVISTGW